MRVVLVLSALIGLLCCPVLAQPASPEAQRDSLRAAYERFEYDRAEAFARAILGRYAEHPPGTIVEAHTTLGILLFARGADVEARQQFADALALDPTLRLDPLLVSPKTVEAFEAVRREAEARRLPAAQDPPPARYVLVRDPRPGAALRSMVVPGWGQFHKRERAKGWAFAGAFVLTAGGFVGAHLQRGRAEDAYLAEDDPARVAERYEAFNTWQRTRGVLGLAAGAVWLASTLDALATGAPEATTSSRALTLGPKGLRIRF